MLNQDCLVSIIAPEDGKYIVQIRESAYGGNGACRYRLHVGTFPRPTAVYPAGGKPGEVINARFIGDAAGDIALPVTIPADAKSSFGAMLRMPGDFALAQQRARGRSRQYARSGAE